MSERTSCPWCGHVTNGYHLAHGYHVMCYLDMKASIGEDLRRSYEPMSEQQRVLEFGQELAVLIAERNDWLRRWEGEGGLVR